MALVRFVSRDPNEERGCDTAAESDEGRVVEGEEPRITGLVSK